MRALDRQQRSSRAAWRLAVLVLLAQLLAPPGVDVLAAATPETAAAPEAAPADRACDLDLPPDLERICRNGVLRVARYGGERPPFFHSTGAGWQGFDVDLGRDIAERLGVAYREDTTAESFDQVIEQVAAGEADIGLSKLSATLERARRVRFTGPYLTVYQALLVNRLSALAGNDPFRALDAAGVVIGALDGSAYVGYAEASFPRASVRPFDDFGEMMRQVVSGEIDAALMDSARANTWRQQNRRQLIQVRTTVDKSRKDFLAIAVGWQDTHLLAWLDLYLETIKADGTARRLYRRWFVDDATDASP